MIRPVSARLSSLVLGALLSILPACATAPPAADTERLVTAALAGTRVQANADVLLDEIGARVSALPSGQRAQDFVADRLRGYGLANVRFEPFPLLAWDRRTADLRLIAPAALRSASLRILSLGHVASATVEAPVIDAGFGTAEEIAALGNAVAGRIVLADVGAPAGYGRGVHRTEKVTLATRAGAVGFVQLNTQPGPLIPVGVATMGDYATRIPAVATDHESGSTLRAALASSDSDVVVRLAVENWMERAVAANVLADLPGRTSDVILVGAHLDSWDLAAGAVDNGSGTLAVLDAARALAEHARRTGETPLRTIRFAFWMGEELGLYGSRYHVEQRLASGELERYVAVLNMDVIGEPLGFAAMGRPEAATFIAPVVAALHAAGLPLRADVNTAGGLYSDHQPFLLQGVAVLAIDTRLPPQAAGVGHTTADTRDRIDERGISRSAAAAAALLWALANDPDPGLPRWAEAGIGRRLEALGLRDPLERAGEWRWP